MRKSKVIVFSYFLNSKYNFTQNVVDWYYSMKENYLVDCDRQFVVYTDNKEVLTLFRGENIAFVEVNSEQTKNIPENKLHKFQYILDCMDRYTFDYFCFIQSNARCLKPVYLSELVGENECDLVVFSHCAFPRLSFTKLYHNKVGSSVDISRINTSEFYYVQNCHFIGNKNVLMDISHFIQGTTYQDRKKADFETWQYKTLSTYDEAYFNYYLNLNLLPRRTYRIRVLDGHTYIHAPYSNRKEFKIDMVDKTKPYKVMYRKPRKISILMASFPHRKKWMLQCISQLIGQCDNFYLWLNEYKEIPEELYDFDMNKLHVTLGDMDLKENGRYLFLNMPEIQNDYCFICDDDINWPNDYVRKTIECFKRHGDNILIAYFINGGLNTYHGYDEIKTGYNVLDGIPHYRFGAGTCAFVPTQMMFRFTYEELVSHYDMELLFAQQCLNNNLKMYSPRRDENWIGFIQDGKNQRDIERYALWRTGRSRIKITYDYMKRKGMVSGNSVNGAGQKFKMFQFG